jgi:hypothetical protein
MPGAVFRGGMAAGVSPNFPDRQSPRDQPGFETGRVARLSRWLTKSAPASICFGTDAATAARLLKTHHVVLAFTRARSAFIGG